MWAGCEPISVWKSTDGGEHFELNRGLWDHPHRSEWGAGYGGAAAHSIVVDPTGEKVHVAMSTGGVYRSLDGGASWEPRNKGISAYFMPDPTRNSASASTRSRPTPPSTAACTPKTTTACTAATTAPRSWESIAEGLPADFGFVMLTHPRRAGTAWVIPLKADGERIPPDGKLAVHRTDDAGPAGNGSTPGSRTPSTTRCCAMLPAWTARSPRASTSGRGAASVYASADEGEHFTEIASHLPDVLCVRAAVVFPRPWFRRSREGMNNRMSSAMVSGDSMPAESAISVVLPSVLQPLAGGQSILTAPAEAAVTVEWLLDTVTGDYPALSRRLRDETGAVRRYVNIYVNGNEIRRLQGLVTAVAPGQEVLIIQSVAGG